MEKKNTPKDYGRWGKIGVKVISKPTDKKGGKKDA
jgi:hypothetical protein